MLILCCGVIRGGVFFMYFTYDAEFWLLNSVSYLLNPVDKLLRLN